MIFLRSSVFVGFHFHLHCVVCDGVIYSFERAQPFSPLKKRPFPHFSGLAAPVGSPWLCLSSWNCGGPSLGNHFGDRIRISVSWFRFYQPLLCLPIFSWDAAVSVMTGIFRNGFISDHCKWGKVGYLISILQTFHRYIFIVSSKSVTKWSKHSTGMRTWGF